MPFMSSGSSEGMKGHQDNMKYSSLTYATWRPIGLSLASFLGRSLEGTIDSRKHEMKRQP